MRHDGGSIVGENKTTYDGGFISDTTLFEGYFSDGGVIRDSFFTLEDTNKRVVSSTVIPGLVRDMQAITTRYIEKTIGKIEVIYTSGFPKNKSFISSDENIILIASDGEYYQVSDGTATITVTDSTGQAETNVLTPPNLIITEETILTFPEEGSFRESLTNSVNDRIVGLSGSDSEKRRFSLQDHATPLYVTSTSCWANEIDFSACSPWNSRGGPTQAGTLVSPRHVILANHFPLLIGDTIRFVSQTGLVVDRTIASVHQISGQDISLAQLDTDVPSFIKFAHILPTNFHEFLPPLENPPYPFPAYSFLPHIPCIYLDQEEKILIQNFATSGSGVVLVPPAETPNSLFYEPVIGGDSGNPIFLINGTNLILLAAFFFSNSGPFITYYMDEINDIMASHPNSYQLVTENLESFNKYPHA